MKTLNLNLKVDHHTGGKWFIEGPKHGMENQLLNLDHNYTLVRFTCFSKAASPASNVCIRPGGYLKKTPSYQYSESHKYKTVSRQSYVIIRLPTDWKGSLYIDRFIRNWMKVKCIWIWAVMEKSAVTTGNITQTPQLNIQHFESGMSFPQFHKFPNLFIYMFLTNGGVIIWQ